MVATTFVSKQTNIATAFMNDVNDDIYGVSAPDGAAHPSGILGRVIDTIATLRTMAKTGPSRNFVTGYYTAGDGGGGAYWYDSTDTTTADNGGSVIVGADGGRWKLIHQGTISARQFGAKGDNATSDSVALQAWITYCYNNFIRAWLPMGTYLCGDLSLTCTGNRITQSFLLFGAGRNASILKQTGIPTSVLTFVGSAPTTGNNAAQVVVQDIGIQGSASKNAFGLTLYSVSDVSLRNVRLESFSRNLNLDSSLLVSAEYCQFANGNEGIYSRRSGTSSYCNSLRIINCTFAGNSSHAGDFGAANNVVLEGNVVETSGTNGTATSGGWIIRNTCDDETGFTKFSFINNDYEVNQGRIHQFEAMTSGLDVEIEGGTSLTPAGANQDIYCAGARRFRIEGFRSLSNPSTWEFLLTDQLILEATKVTTLTDAGVTYPWYINAEANGTTYVFGRSTSYTGTLTGVSAGGTGTVKTVQQGDMVWVTLESDIYGTSNSVACTMAGMAAPTRPSSGRLFVAMTRDNGVDYMSQISLATTGIFTLRVGFSTTFTNPGQKGITAICLPPYKI